MSLLIGLFARLGLPEQFRKAAAWAAIIALGLLVAGILKSCYDRGVIDRHNAKVEQHAAKAREQAADERVSDAATNSATERDMHDAIDTAPKGGTLSPAAHALACDRLRRRGGRLPADCRP